MAAASLPSFEIRYVGLIKSVSTTPPSVVIIPQHGGPLITATDFTPAKLSTMLMCLSVDMRQVTYIMKPYPTGWQAHEVLCVGEVSSGVEEEPGDVWLREAGGVGKKAKGGRRKGKANANNSKLVCPPVRDIEKEWSLEGNGHETLQSKPDPIMGHLMTQAILHSERMVSKEVLENAGNDVASLYPASGKQDSKNPYALGF